MEPGRVGFSHDDIQFEDRFRHLRPIDFAGEAAALEAAGVTPPRDEP
jgi:hypothetical protein